MASSRKSVQATSAIADVTEQFERALEAILARVVVSDVSVAIAYSGGLDSAVLLQLATRYCHRHQIKLTALHVHHGLSPNADEWLRHCEQQAIALHVPFEAARITLENVNEAGIEQAARVARYAALGDLCRRHGASLLLTAHHQDDQAETVLLQLFRGTGLRGLSGMHELHDENALLGGAVMLARPLLPCSRKQLENYAAELQIAHVQDESNTDTRYRRNAIRQQIMPMIDRHYPGVAATMARSAQHWQSAQQLLDELAAIDLAKCAEGSALKLSAMTELSEQRVDNLLRHWLLVQGAPYPPSTAQLSQLRMQMLDARADAHPSIALCGLQLQRRGSWLMATEIMRGQPPVEPMQVQWRGEREIEIPEWQGSLLFTESESTGICPQRLQASALTLQPRAGGERLKPDPTRPSRTLKNLFQEAALPAQQRPWLPLAYLDGQLVFAAGLGMDVRHADARGGVVLGWRGA
ncbi:MAG: tRNA lysidine(34) synthetase TilS [Burkholderiaceae bacterium]